MKLVFVSAAILVNCIAAAAQTTQRLSVDATGGEVHGSSGPTTCSANGRFVVFGSDAADLVPGDTNGTYDVFVFDRLTGAVSRISVDSAGAQGDGPSGWGVISNDGRYVAFESDATNLVAGDTNQVMDVFVRDRLLGTTVRVSVDPSGGNSNNNSWIGWISGAGRFVSFASDASNLVAGDTNFVRDAFVRDLQSGVTDLVSVSSSGVQGNGGSFSPRVSDDGRFVAFGSSAANLVAGDTNQRADTFLRDRLLGTTEIVSISSAGAASDDDSGECAISAGGRYVAFSSAGSTLVAGDTNATWDVFLRDRLLGTTERISVSSAGVGSNAYCFQESISADGRFVAFMGAGTNLVPGDTNGWNDIFIRDRSSGATTRVSLGQGGAQGNDGDSASPVLSRDGRFIAFSSFASNLVTGDTNGTTDVFGRDWQGIPGIDLCQPGTGIVIACPCANPAAGSPRGCDNSSATGGAQLESSGPAELSQDGLVLATNGELPTATSILLQGTAEIASGMAMGHGVRCTGGSLERLFVKTATGGSITAPGPGDPSISARSAALGDTISAGTSRFYAVYYRDPIVLGGCSAAFTYNITQTQGIVWAP